MNTGPRGLRTSGSARKHLSERSGKGLTSNFKPLPYFEYLLHFLEKVAWVVVLNWVREGNGWIL